MSREPIPMTGVTKAVRHLAAGTTGASGVVQAIAIDSADPRYRTVTIGGVKYAVWFDVAMPRDPTIAIGNQVTFTPYRREGIISARDIHKEKNNHG